MFTLPLQELADLSILYSQSHRHYHNITHINDLLSEMYNWFDASALHRASDSKLCPSKVLSFAIWYHDAVYNPYAPHTVNEMQSAKLLFQSKDAFKWIGPEGIDIAYDAILRTSKHTITQGFDATHLGNDIVMTMLDLDLVGFGRSFDVYAANSLNIRKEYHSTSNRNFLKGRLNFLYQIKKRDSLYYNDYFKGLYDVQSKQNIRQEIHLIETALDGNNIDFYFNYIKNYI